jgi:hypothetical protein
MPLIQCPTCSKTLNVADENLSKRIRCAGCKSVFQPLPSAPGAVSPAPPSEPEARTSIQPEATKKNKARKAQTGSPWVQSRASDYLENAGAVRAQRKTPAALNRASWCLLAGAVCGLGEAAFLAGWAGYEFIVHQAPGSNLLANLVFITVAAILGVILLILSFHFHPRRSFGIAMIAAFAGVAYGLLNAIPCICCGIVSTVSVAGQASEGLPGALIAGGFVFLVLPATVLPPVGGILGMVQLMKPEVKALFLD